MKPSPLDAELSTRRASGANRPARNFDELVERNWRRTAALHGREPRVDFSRVAFVLALTELEQRTTHVEAAQFAPVVDHERSPIEETLDAFLRIRLRSVREIGDRRNGSVGEAQ